MTNGTMYIFAGWLDQPALHVSRENTKRMKDSLPFWLYSFALEFLDESEVETNEVLGEGDRTMWHFEWSPRLH